MNKVQKIREWISKEQDGLMDAQGNFEYPEHEGAYHILCNIDAYIDSLQEEPVSNPIDFEKELYKAFGQVKDFTLGMRIAKRFYDMGKNSQEPVSEELEETAKKVGQKYFQDEDNIWARPNYEAVKAECAFKEGANWQKVKTLSDMKKAVTGKAFQFSMENVEAWGDDSNGNGKTIKLKGRVTFQVNNPESIIDALFTELENDKQE